MRLEFCCALRVIIDWLLVGCWFWFVCCRFTGCFGGVVAFSCFVLCVLDLLCLICWVLCADFLVVFVDDYHLEMGVLGLGFAVLFLGT